MNELEKYFELYNNWLKTRYINNHITLYDIRHINVDNYFDGFSKFLEEVKSDK